MTFNIFTNTNTFSIILNAKFITDIGMSYQWSHYHDKYAYGALRKILGCTYKHMTQLKVKCMNT